jgi:hypothetical protein
MSRYIFLLVAFLLVSCSPPEVQLQTTSAQAPTVSPTNTALANTPTASKINTPLPQAPTASSTHTPAPAPAHTNTPTQESTPDMRIIIGEPLNFLPGHEDIPYQYWNPGIASWDSPISNDEIINLLGAEEGRKYINKTTRVLGHKRCLLRSTGNVYFPEVICFKMVFYETIEGASLALSPDWDPLNLYGNEMFIDGLESIGDESYFTYEEHHISGNDYDVNYTVRFRIRNVQVGVNIWGRKGFMDIQFLISLAKMIEGIFLYAPMINP